MVDPNVQPTACHTPIPVPVHWQDEVKVGLDQAMQLRVIEPVLNHHTSYLVPQDGVLS